MKVSCLVTLTCLQYEARTKLDRFSGSSSISSADLFDDPKKQAGETPFSGLKTRFSSVLTVLFLNECIYYLSA